MRRGSGTCWCGAPVYVLSRREDKERPLLAVPPFWPLDAGHEPVGCPAQTLAFTGATPDQVLSAGDDAAYQRRKRRRRIA